MEPDKRCQPRQFRAAPRNRPRAAAPTPLYRLMFYRAEKCADGTYAIFDVPIFGELPKGVRGNDEVIDRSWMLAAVENARFEFQERGYLAPLNFRHKDVIDRREAVGCIRPTRVGKLAYEGKDLDVVYADLVKVPEHAFRRIVAGEFRYRSPEIYKRPDGSWPPIGEFRLNALALLDTDEPYFRFPMLDGETIKLEAGGAATLARFDAKDAQPQPLRAVLVGPKGAVALFSFNEKPLPAAAPKGDDPAAKEREKLQAEIAELKAQLDQKEREMQKLGATPNNPKPAELGTDPSAVVKLAAQVAALEAKDEKRDIADAVEARYKAAVAELKGWHLTEATHARIRKFAAMGDEAIKELVAHFKAAVPRDPLPLEQHPRSAEEAPEVAKFQAEGPERLEAARKASREFDQLKQAGAPLASTREAFILSRIGKAA